MTATIVTFEIMENPAPRLDKALARDVPPDASLSRSRMARLLADGAVKVNGAVVTDPRAKPTEGDVIEISVEITDDYHVAAEDIPLDVVFEDDDLIVINKPTGMVVHPAPGTPGGTLVNALLHHCGAALSGVGGEKRPGIVHRIDKETSGLLVVAKTDRAHHGLAAQFEAHTVERHYRAICYGVPDSNDPRVRGIKGASFEAGNILKLQTQLARHKHDRQKQAVVWHNGRHAVTRARIVQPLGTPGVAALLDCWLETGRTHQIRVHLTHAGHGLIGDPTYGGRRKLSEKAVGEAGRAAAYTFPRQALHAATLGFEHPVSNEMLRFEAPMPSDMTALVAALTAPKD
ncbi:Ribosomal large subunit pseudouridine synthase D [Nymphon striatum]|nr:Ribosomal large subunit pseudouridine synthase D [Nymphon striatum]